MECYSAFKKKKKEIFPFAPTWTPLEEFMISEVSQSEKDNIDSLIYEI